MFDVRICLTMPTIYCVNCCHRSCLAAAATNNASINMWVNTTSSNFYFSFNISFRINCVRICLASLEVLRFVSHPIIHTYLSTRKIRLLNRCAATQVWYFAPAPCIFLSISNTDFTAHWYLPSCLLFLRKSDEFMRFSGMHAACAINWSKYLF